ncbi:DUF4116 domain-containing protein, partial [Endozoicomonas sp. ONNA2]|uniref:DUF4116 domain-containing protein n=1 Tax=Endozoicomonas sp. ONNA2 TaxID=2828741 RepID=UPI002147E147
PLVAELRQAITKLEDLLLCPVDVEFAIDHQGRLFLLQVRPVTRLPGGMDFALPIPAETLASGEGISEGYGTGPLWLANKQAAHTMPEGAIVVTQYAKEWMLERDFLKRVGGFVLAQGGSTDHVAITLRQKGIPLILVGGQYPTVAAQDGQQVTLACARFNGKPGAFIVTGDITKKLATYSSPSPAFSDEPLTKAVPSRESLSPPEGTFHQVASGFQWLTDQNARLLTIFAPGGGLDCLANPVKLSMSPQRSKIVAATRDGVNRLVYGAEALLEGYRAFLLLAGNSRSDQVQSWLDELPHLITRFETLKQTIRSRLETITRPLHGVETPPLSEGMFRQWVVACHQLQSCLQALDPLKAGQVHSVHELIFALHQRFVEALAPVTLASGQGSLSKRGYINFVDCTLPGEVQQLLTPSTKKLIEGAFLAATVIGMADALIVNLKLGYHAGLIELLEHAEGGKGRTLRLKYSDRFFKPDGSDEPGKLKRMWFLVQLLKAIELDKNACSMTVSCNTVAGKLIIECPQMTSRETMQDAFVKLLTALNAMENLDLYFEDRPIIEGNQWNFNLLAQRLAQQRLDSDFTAEDDRFAFQHCLFSIVHMNLKKIFSGCKQGSGCCESAGCCQLSRCYPLLSNHLQQFIDHSRRLAACAKKSDAQLRKMLMSDGIDEDTRRKLIHHLLLSNYKNATPLVDLVYDLREQCYVIEPSYDYRLKFRVPPGQSLSDHKEKVRNILLKEGLQYASQLIRNNKDLVLPTIAIHPNDLKCVSRELKNDKDVVMSAVTQQGIQLQYASPEFQDNDEIVMAAIKQRSSALKYASERIRSDKNVIQIVIADSIFSLNYASKTLLKDREYMLNLIEQDSRTLMSADDCLTSDEAFLRSAIRRNPEVLHTCYTLSRRLQPLLQKSQCSQIS